MTKHLFVLFTFLLALASASACDYETERDPSNEFLVSRPRNWFPQEKAFLVVRIMLGLQGDGYGGNCNIVVVESDTSTLSQESVDQDANRRKLPHYFFESLLEEVPSEIWTW